MPIRRKNPTGPYILLEDALRTYRGKRVHFLDSETGAALCGAGLPNREFPFGSVEYLSDHFYKKGAPKKVKLTCYRCLKILYMEGKINKEGNLIVREFYPTDSLHREGAVNKRWEHVMIPDGRPKGGMWEEWLQDIDPEKLTTSSWIPGPDYARTQSKAWGSRQDVPEEEKEFTTEPLAPQNLTDSDYKRLPQLQRQRGEMMKSAQEERGVLLAYFDALEGGPPIPRRGYKKKRVASKQRKIAKSRFDIDDQYQRLKKQNER